jgi:hypothetical protein
MSGVETITIDGKQIETLKELLRPGLRFVVVGLNPACRSVAAGHYYQGRLGQLFSNACSGTGSRGRCRWAKKIKLLTNKAWGLLIWFGDRRHVQPTLMKRKYARLSLG